jgi:hypothetical protein
MHGPGSVDALSRKASDEWRGHALSFIHPITDYDGK